MAWGSSVFFGVVVMFASEWFARDEEVFAEHEFGEGNNSYISQHNLLSSILSHL